MDEYRELTTARAKRMMDTGLIDVRDHKKYCCIYHVVIVAHVIQGPSALGCCS